MVISNENLAELKNISLHDYTFLEFNYDAICKEIAIKLEEPSSSAQQLFLFKSVESFEKIGGESWGRDSVFPRIFEFVYMDSVKGELLSKLERRVQSYSQTTLNHKEQPSLFQLRFLFVSGDVLDILCKSVEISPINVIKSKNMYVYNYLTTKEKESIIKDSTINRKWLEGKISDIEISFIHKEKPELFDMNGVKSCFEYLNNLPTTINIKCRVLMSSDKSDEVFRLWVWFISKSGYIIKMIEAKFDDCTVFIDDAEVNRLIKMQEKMMQER